MRYAVERSFAEPEKAAATCHQLKRSPALPV
jgi:hypothetical protein